MKPRVFFGTLYSIESEFEDCKLMVQSQKGLLENHHQIIQGLKEKDAHNALWNLWESKKSNFDLFVKIDADTILTDDEAISRVWKLFENNKRVTGAQVKLLDYFTDSLIPGLNFFSPEVKFNASPDLYCDRVDVNHDIVLKGEPVRHLEPIGYHCKNPSFVQSFHYGLHRMLKNQKDTIKKVSLANREKAREYALLGAAYAIQHKTKFLNGNNSSYDDQVFIDSFFEIENMFENDRSKLVNFLLGVI